MECTSSRRRRRGLSRCLLLVCAVAALLCHSPGPAAAAAAPRRLLQTCPGQDFDVPHAHLRARDNVKPLKYTEELSARAAQWAQQFRSDCEAAAPAPGINVFLGAAGATWLPSDAVAAWAEEEQHYDYGSNSCSTGKACGRYTQMVWRGSKEFGCAVVDCDSGKTLMACLYEPQGNVAGQRPF
ncbi:Pathogenesis-related protein 1 [Zea mays]|jgi:pathogenesis-related protein 1|uniref:Pathogenesis-related protein 1 n=1 Tax=Zea mays TaxID=4577 RepID=A0A3L6EV92_MAIZE|nr:Pathogenesis-related protein 1 [Zea mays]